MTFNTESWLTPYTYTACFKGAQKGLNKELYESGIILKIDERFMVKTNPTK